MVSKGGLEVIAILAILALAGIYTGVLKLPTQTQSLTQPGGSTTIQPGSIPCSISNPTLGLVGYYPNATANNGAGGITQAAMAYNGYSTGTVQNIGTGATSATTTTALGSGTVSAGGQYTVFFGNDASNGYGTNATTVTVGCSQSTPVKGIAVLLSNPTLTFKNGSSSGFTGYGGHVNGAANGQTITGTGAQSVQILVSAGQGWFGYPGQTFVVDFSANPNVVSNIGSLSNAGTGQSYPTVSTGILPTETTFSGDSNFAFAVPSISNYQGVTLNPQITLATIPTYNYGNSVTTQNAIGVYLIQSLNYMYATPSGQEQLVTGVYVKPGVAGNVAVGAVTSNTVGISFSVN